MSVFVVAVILALASFSVVFATAWAVIATRLLFAAWREIEAQDGALRLMADSIAAKPRPVLRLYDWRNYEKNARRN